MCDAAGWTSRFVKSNVWLNGVGLSDGLDSADRAARDVRWLSVIMLVGRKADTQNGEKSGILMASVQRCVPTS